MCGLPLDICSEIFLRSCAESLIRFRAVCKEWCAAIDDPCFVKTHTEQQQQLPSTTILIRCKTGHPFYPLYSIDLQTLDFADGLQSFPAAPLNISRDGLSWLPELPAAACNGLMLIRPLDGESNWEIWNILTHERLQLPRLDFAYRWNPNGYDNKPVVSEPPYGPDYSADLRSPNGLGYDAAIDDYKAVVIVREVSKPLVHHTHVYSLRSDSWKEIANFPCVDRFIASSIGVFLGGALHWVTWQGIIVLDMKTESYRQLDLPPLHDRGENYKETSDRELGIHELSGCLMVSDAGTNDHYPKHFDLWVMKDDGTWMDSIASTRSYRSYAEFDLRPVAYTKNKMHIFLQDYCTLFLFDVESKSRKTVCIHGLYSGKVETQAFQGSIFRLHDNCGRVNSDGSFDSRIKTSTDIETELIFCLRDDAFYTRFDESFSHYGCFSLDSNCCYSSTKRKKD